MKRIILFFLVINNCYGQSEKQEDKIYTVPAVSPEILIGSETPPLKGNSNERPKNLFYAGVIRGDLNYKLPGVSGETNHFSQDLLGGSVSKKTADHLFFYHGYYEAGVDWQHFKREAGSYSQKINVVQINLLQNFDLYWSSKHFFFFSAGLGIAPVYLTAEQSVLGNSFSKAGALGLLKCDFVFPVKKQFELDFNLKGGWGNIGGNKIFLSTLGLGINFE